MRPKKVILLVDEDANRLSERATLLRVSGGRRVYADFTTHGEGYRVLCARDVCRAQENLRDHPPGAIDVMVVSHRLGSDRIFGGNLVRYAQERHPEMRVLVLPEKDQVRAAELLARLAGMVARKRGPKTKPVASVPARESEAAA